MPATLLALVLVAVVAIPVSAQPVGGPGWIVPPTRQAMRPAALTSGPRVAFSHPAIADLLVRVSARSPFLRRQLARLAREPRLELSIGLSHRDRMARIRAVTHIEDGADGTVRASVTLGIEVDTPELLGHEFEHILERLDGVRVHQRRRLGDAGVRPSNVHAFETVRAQLAGRIVAAEYAGRRLEVQP